ncbi:CUE domain-containing protein [Plectosphaerella plurivora]|uniref:Coupling of ubiquitin conjugation to ER degradation protein 1 n=1 Tax=Plectosphaerella plurivora TaxID=936078 RepID=A0A9P9A9V8_9PEZI|nr:CUE domain-containing protein [Plectosphaerella plurivora]
MANPGDANQISLPYLILIVIIAGGILRFLFFSSDADAAANAQRHNPLNVLRTREAAVERIQQMFPQVDRRTILWDLQRNGGNIQTTSERILSGQIERPPVTFQPPPPPGRATSTAAAAPKQPAKPAQPDLITRYNLHDKVADEAKQQDQKGKAWSSDRDERQAALQRRRDDMILQARRKMEERIAAEKAAQGS